eukprot:PhM_4_TR2898/c0_g1_i1/m.77001
MEQATDVITTFIESYKNKNKSNNSSDVSATGVTTTMPSVRKRSTSVSLQNRCRSAPPELIQALLLGLEECFRGSPKVHHPHLPTLWELIVHLSANHALVLNGVELVQAVMAMQQKDVSAEDHHDDDDHDDDDKKTMLWVYYALNTSALCVVVDDVVFGEEGGDDEGELHEHKNEDVVLLAFVDALQQLETDVKFALPLTLLTKADNQEDREKEEEQEAVDERLLSETVVVPEEPKVHEQEQQQQEEEGGADDVGEIVEGHDFDITPTPQVPLYTRHRMRFITQLHQKPATSAQKSAIIIGRQQQRCKGCLVLFSYETRMLGGKVWASTFFCYYTGYYYCPACHGGYGAASSNSTSSAASATSADRLPIPARMLLLWDFDAYPVCRDAASFLQSVWSQPIVCISAINPTLFDRVLALRIARQIRLQLQMFYETCSDCSAFCDLARRKLADSMYLLEGTEMYSLRDVHQLRQCAILPPSEENLMTVQLVTGISDTTALLTPKSNKLASAESSSSAVDPAGLHVEDFLKQMKDIRSLCIKHIVRMCKETCYKKAARQCMRCGSKEPIFAFDINNVTSCPRCKSLFHRACYRAEPCRVCASSANTK